MDDARCAWVLMLGLAGVQASASEPCTARSGAQVIPLVELYTSEGCSSCPPADRWLSRQLDDDSVNWLAFHVDYWDAIGWPDRFALPAYSQRQRERVGAAGGDTVYTPQVMVGQQVQANWRTGGRMRATLEQARTPATTGLALQLQRDGANWQLTLGASRPGESPGDGAQVWLAQYIDGQSTQVRAGENRGATLRHDRVVSKLRGPWPLGETPLSQRFLVDAPAAPWGATAFVQDARGRVLQSLTLAASACDIR